MVTEFSLALEPVTACPVCGTTRFAPEGTLQQYGIELHYDRCQCCGVLFLNPRMTDAQTEEYYQGLYRELLKGDGWTVETDLAIQAKRAKAQAAVLRPHLGDVNTHLEIGCSAGYLLEAAGVLYSTGVEPDESYHRLEPARQFRVVSSLAQLPPMKYDLISLSHVLEHINHPWEYLRALLDKHAHAGTLVMVEVPNAGANNEAFLIHHPQAFEPFSLLFLFARLGWRTRDTWLRGQIGEFAMMLFERMEG